MIGRGNIGTFLCLGLLAEFAVFVAVAERIGFGSAILLTVLTSFVGFAALKRSSAAALAGLRAMANERAGRDLALVDGMLGALGALLLIVPGFLTDLVGLALLAPSGRQWLARRLGAPHIPAGRRQPGPAGTIDLDAEDWRRLDPLRRP